MRENISVSGHWLFTWQDQDGNILQIREEKNLITQSGLNAIAAIFLSEIPQNNALYLALGTGTIAAASGDAALGVEGFRKIITTKDRDSNELRLRFYLTTSEANGNWSEMGVFIAGTTIPGSGHLLNRVVPPGGISKARNQTLTIEVRIPFRAV